MSDREKVYGLAVCEWCDKSSDVLYKCYIPAPHTDHLAFVPANNVVYKCYECAFGEDCEI